MSINIDDIYEELMSITSYVGVRVDCPIEAQIFFDKKADQFNGDNESFIDFVKNNINKWFISLNSAPDWIQESEWQFINENPMIFVGDHRIKADSIGNKEEIAFYLFWDPGSGETKVVQQIG